MVYSVQNKYICLIKEFKIINKDQNTSTMDIFQFPDDYKPEKNLTDKEMEDITDYLKNHPLFLKEVPEDLSTNEHLVALQSFQEDQDPNQMAETLNKEGSSKLKQKPNEVYHMKYAYKKYTQGINIKCSDPSINAKLHANRASLNLKLKNYGKVIEDCKMCLKHDENYLKGYYRYAKALNALQKYEETLKLLEQRKQVQLQEFKDTAQAKLKQLKNKQEEKQKKKQQVKSQIVEYCKQKKWNLLKRDQPLPEGAEVKMVNGKLSVPLMVIYPQFSQFDIIASSFENEKIRQHFKQLMEGGLPWDAKKQYENENIEIYCQMTQAVMMKIPWQAKIGQIASRVPIRGCLQFHLVAKENEFYNKFISSYKII